MLPGLPRLVRGRRRRDDHRRHGIDRPHDRDRRVVRRDGAALRRGTARSPTPATTASTRATGTHILWLDADERLEAERRDAAARAGRASPSARRTGSSRRTSPGQEEVGTAANHLALRLLAQPPAVPLLGRDPRADPRLDADRPARALRDLDAADPPLRLPQEPHRGAQQARAQPDAAAGASSERDAAQRLHALQPRHRVRRDGRHREGARAPRGVLPADPARAGLARDRLRLAARHRA